MIDTMDDLVTWLRAQLEADERVARAAIQGPWRTGAIAEHLVDDVIYGTSPFAHAGPGGDKIVQVANLEMAWEKEANAAHMVRHDPARVLLEVEAKRRLLDEYEKALDRRRLFRDDVASAGALLQMVAVVKLLALPYSDRPGYREDWRP